MKRGFEHLNCAIASRTQRDETVLCFSLLRIFFSFSGMSMVSIADSLLSTLHASANRILRCAANAYLCEQSTLFFLLGLPPSFLASPLNFRARALPLLNLKKKRDCSHHWDTASFPFPSFLPFYFLNPRVPVYLGAWNRLGKKGTRRIPDHPTYHPPTLDTSTFSPQIARQIIQDGGNLVARVAACTGVYNLLSSQTQRPPA